MSLLAPQKSKDAYLNKIDNRKIRKASEKADHRFTNDFLSYYNSSNAPKDRKHERFKIRLRLANKLLERNYNIKLKSELEVENNEVVLKITPKFARDST